MNIRHTAHALTAMAVFLFLTLAAAHTTQARDPEDFLIRNQIITLEVECLDEAMQQMANLPGFELSSNINLTEGWGRADHIIDSRDLHLAMSVLQGMGTMVNSSSRAENAFARWTALRRETAVRQHEYTRLVELLHGTTTMQAFNTVETRLNTVINTMDRLRGELQGLEFEMGTTRIGINLRIPEPEPEEEEYEPEPEPEPEEEPEPELNPFQRIARAFTQSAGLTGRIVQGAITFLAYISIPLAGFLIILAIVLWARKRKKGKGGDDSEK